MSDALANALCLNCGHALAAPGCFCPQCGQAPAHRLSTAHVGHEVLHVFTHADKGIFAFLPQVLLRPGRLVADFLAGRRKRHFSPFQFLLLAVGLVTVVAQKTGYYDLVGESVQRRIAQSGATPFVLSKVSTYFHSLGQYFNVWWLLLLPLHAVGTWLVYQRRTGLNYAEAVLMQVVVGCAFQLWLLLFLPTVLLLVGRQPGASSAQLQGLITFAYLTLVGRQGLGLTWGGAAWRAAAAGLLGAFISFGMNYAAFNWHVYGH